jgi:hypothetical protein
MKIYNLSLFACACFFYTFIEISSTKCVALYSSNAQLNIHKLVCSPFDFTLLINSGYLLITPVVSSNCIRTLEKTEGATKNGHSRDTMDITKSSVRNIKHWIECKIQINAKGYFLNWYLQIVRIETVTYIMFIQSMFDILKAALFSYIMPTN